VLPQSLCRAFARSQEYPVAENEYRNGETQRSAAATNSRKRWRLVKRLTSDRLQQLRTFYAARKGPTEPFYFYDPYETNPKFSWDPTGVAIAGRYTVRFDCGWEQSCGLGRSDVTIELLELA
jgi:phage-related protein